MNLTIYDLRLTTEIMELWINIPFFGILFIGLIITAIGLFGNAVIFCATVLYAFLTGFYPIGIRELLVIGLLYGIGEFMEYILTLLGVRWLGASRISGWMAILGTIIGAIYGGSILWGIGIIIGGFLGAFLGAFITELIIKNKPGPTLKAGLGAFIGKAGAVFFKLSIAIIIVVYIMRILYASGNVL